MSQRKAGLIADAVFLCFTTFGGAALAADKRSYAYQGISLTHTNAKDGCQSIHYFTSLTGSFNDTATRWKISGGNRVSYFFTPEIGVLTEYEVIKGVGDKNGFGGSMFR